MCVWVNVLSSEVSFGKLNNIFNVQGSNVKSSIFDRKKGKNLQAMFYYSNQEEASFTVNQMKGRVLTGDQPIQVHVHSICYHCMNLYL